MNRQIACIICGALWGMAPATMMGQPFRLFIQQAAEDPNGVSPEGITIVAHGGDLITFDVYIEHAPERVLGIQVTMPCVATGGDGGSVSFVPPIMQDVGRPDYLFYGPRYCRAGTNIGLVCATDADCPDSPPGNDCILASSFPVTDDGDCPAPPPPAGGNPRAATAAGIGVPAVVVTTPRYFATFNYHVSEDASGEFVIIVPNEPCSDPHCGRIPLTTSGATIIVPTAQCCAGLSCADDLPRAVCESQGWFWNPNRTCGESCACSSAFECLDANVCTHGSCTPNGCANSSVRFGNVDGDLQQFVTLNDILCVIGGFVDFNACVNGDIDPGCTGDGAITIGDILDVLGAFGGLDKCGCNP